MTKKDATTRAQEALDVAERRVKKLDAKLLDAESAVENLRSDLESARSRRDYLAQNPDLPTQDPS